MQKFMPARPQSSTRRKKPANLSLDEALASEAKALGIKLSQAAEEGIRQEVARVKAVRWKAENAAALESSNQWVEENGLPLERFRKF